MKLALNLKKKKKKKRVFSSRVVCLVVDLRFFWSFGCTVGFGLGVLRSTNMLRSILYRRVHPYIPMFSLFVLSNPFNNYLRPSFPSCIVVTQNSDLGSHIYKALVSPPHYVRPVPFKFIARIFQLLLPSSTRVEMLYEYTCCVYNASAPPMLYSTSTHA